MVDNGWNRNWHGKAKRRAQNMEYSTYCLIKFLNRLKLLPEDFRDDWNEEFRCYTNRVLGKL
jgi:hypothetical protein